MSTSRARRARRAGRAIGMLVSAALAVVLAAPAAVAGPLPAQSTVTASATAKAQLTALADWLLGAQRPDGAIANYPNGNFIAPYGADYAAMGLASAYKLTGNRAYATAAWSWLHWYASHEQANGVVDEFNVNPDGTETDTGGVDSTDATAGLFLAAAYLTFHYTNDKKQLSQISAGITGAVNAIDLTRDGDGMTWATPGYHVKYLMDLGETYDGLRHASDLFGALNQHAAQAAAQQRASAMYAGVQTLWDDQTGAFDWAKGDTGWVQQTNWKSLYPDSAEQAWAVAFGLTTSSERSTIMANFTANQPNWASPTATAQFMTNGALTSGTVGYWPTPALAFQQSGDQSTLVTSADSITAAAAATSYAWPFDTGAAGQLALDRYAQTVGSASVV